MKSVFTLVGSLILILLHQVSFSQNAPEIEWEHAMGGNKYDVAYGVAIAPGGGYFVAGYTHSTGGDVSGHIGHFDYWVVRLSEDGDLLWQKCLGGTKDDLAYAISSTNDKGCIVVGSTVSTDGDVTGLHSTFPDFWAVKLDSSGNLQWQKCLGGTNYDVAKSVRATSDGGYIVAGYASSNDGDVSGNHGVDDYWIVKLDSAGNMQWQKSLGGSQEDYGRSIALTEDGGYIVAGYSNSNDGDVTGNHGGNDFWIVKLDSSGNLLWQKSFGGTAEEQAAAIQVTDDGYIVNGFTFSNDGDVSGNHGINDYWVVKLNKEGVLAWQKCLGGTSDDYGNDVAVSFDGSVIVTGMVASNDGDVSGNHGDKDFWVVKLDASGDLQWSKCLGGSSYDEAYAVIQSPDGGYITVGETDSGDGDVTDYHNEGDYWAVKLISECAPVTAAFSYSSSDLSLSFTDASSFATSWHWDFGDGSTSTSQNPVHTFSATGSYNVCLVASDSCSSDSVCQMVDLIATSTSAFMDRASLIVSPNPFSEKCSIQFSLVKNSVVVINLLDIRGRNIESITNGNFNAGSHQLTISRETLTAGIYFIQLKTDTKYEMLKITVQ